MSYDLSKPLVIGISSRALFNLEQENKIFEEQGVEAYEAYQVAHENEILQKGAAFQLIKAFLELNNTELGRLVEVIIMSRNNANTCLRIFNSIQYYGLDITRATLTSGAEIAPYLKAFKTDLFLSANSVDVQSAINDGIAAGRILTGDAHADPKQKINQIRIAFDGDAVLFSAESEKIFQKNGIQAFEEHEKANANTPMAKGPFANFLTKLSYVQQMFKEKEIQPIRTALVTSRNAPAHERAVLQHLEHISFLMTRIYIPNRLQRLFRRPQCLIGMEIIRKNKQRLYYFEGDGENNADIYICFKRKI